ncbi:TPA: helix-turn-helix transcriptional regulator [Providencia alcalifaciens]
MTKDEIDILSNRLRVFDGKRLSQQQREISIRYALGDTIDDIGVQFGISPSAVRKQLAIVRESFGDVSASGLRTIIFMKLICSWMISFNKHP